MTTLTDINIDCLENCMYLGLKDPLNVADANKYIKKAACESVFAQKYRVKPFIIRAQQETPRDVFEITDDYISTDDLKTSLQLFRCFGHLITKMQLKYRNRILHRFFGARLTNSKLHREVIGYVTEYARESLKELIIENFQTDSFVVLVKPFSKVECLRILNSYLDKNWTEFKILFPNLRDLVFDGDNRLADKSCIENNFPHLKKLVVSQYKQQHRGDAGCTKSPQYFDDNKIAAAIRLNPKLEFVMLKNEYLTKSIVSAIRVLSDLKHFGIKWQLDIDGRPIFQDVTKPIYFKHLKTLYLHDIRWDSFPAIPLEIDSIEDFHIITGSKRPENLVAFTLNMHQSSSGYS